MLFILSLLVSEPLSAATAGLAGNPPVITSPPLANGYAGLPFKYRITATNAPTLFLASGLPASLQINGRTGLISGTLANSGTYSIVIAAKNSSGTAKKWVNLFIRTPTVVVKTQKGRPVLTVPVLCDAHGRTLYTYQPDAATPATAPNLPDAAPWQWARISDKPVAGPGINATLGSKIKDGKTILTINGLPAYYHTRESAGETTAWNLPDWTVFNADGLPMEKAEVIVYGGTPSGIMAAIAAARHGHSVALIDINKHLGGVVSGGLTETDIGDSKTVGGVVTDFFARIKRHYVLTYGANSPQDRKSHNGRNFEPHVAEAIFEQMLREWPNIRIWRRHRYQSLTLHQGNIESLTVEHASLKFTRTFVGDLFIDASYEGDVMAGAKVPYRVGREARAEFGEYLAGVQAGPEESIGSADHRVMAYNYRVTLTPFTPNRVLFPKPANYDPEPWRPTVGNRILKNGFKHFADLYNDAAAREDPNYKLDTNWGNLVGGNVAYPDGDWRTRDRIAARHRDHFLSLLYYLQNDPELPADFRADARKWGLPADEFTDNGHFPFQMYIREARRMVGRYVLRERDLTQSRFKTDGVCSGSYGIDCHWIRIIYDEKGRRFADITPHLDVSCYDIPYASLTPENPANLLVSVCISATHVAYCSLRMEPVYMMLGQAAGSAAHLALESHTTVQEVNVNQLRRLLRKEGAILDSGYMPAVHVTWTPARPKPGEKVTFQLAPGMIKDPLNQVWWDFEGAGKVSAKGPSASHTFELGKLYQPNVLVTDAAGRRRLISVQVPVGAASRSDFTVDDFDATLSGKWNATYPKTPLLNGLLDPDIFFGPGIHRSDGKVSALFQPVIPRTGRYKVCVGFRPAADQATNMPVTIRHAGGDTTIIVNERQETTPFNFTPIGTFTFNAGSNGYVKITNDGANGLVAIDGVRWIWLGE
ncbi:MAG TPA: FAD-dependent oxidoreductase [Chthoniobacterales bacterium]